MQKWIGPTIIMIAGLAVGIADACIKKSTQGGSFISAIKSPWMLLAILLYVLQFACFIFVFTNQWKLGIVSNIQIVFFSITAILIGYFFFQEKLSVLQLSGILIAIAGVILMNITPNS